MEEPTESADSTDDRTPLAGGDLLADGDNLYSNIYERTAIAIAVLEGATVVDCNSTMLDLFGGPADEFIGKTPWEISPVAEFDGVPSKSLSREYVREAYKDGLVRFDWLHKRPDGVVLNLDVTLTRIDLADGPRVIVSVRDLTSIRSAERRLREHIEFQERLTNLSNALMRARHQDTNDVISGALRQIGESYGLDRIRLWWDDAQSQTGYISHEWQRHGDSGSSGRTIKLNRVSWSAKLIRAGKNYYFTTIDELPDEAAGDRAFCIAEGVKSLFVAPIALDGQVTGTASFATLDEEKKWSPRLLNELRLLAQTLGFARQRDEYLRKVEQHEAELVRSQHVARVGSFAETARAAESLLDGYGDLRLSLEACAIYGIEPGSETVERAVSHIHPDDRERVLKAATDSFEGKSTGPIEYRVVHADETVVHVEERAEVEYDDAGRPVRWFGTVQDVTDRVENRHKLENALEVIEALASRLQDENVYLKQEVSLAHRADRLVGEASQFRNTLASVEKVAPTDVTVLILGETGTGKELIAREVHALSLRSDKPLINVNCAALSSELIESELFGHEAGAFTGAEKQRKGRFELADGGTLFLDEIGDLPLDVQAKILRVLQTGQFERLGGMETLQVDVRLITATHRNLQQMVGDGKFRADLFYRINNFPIEMPALRERTDDIPLLASYFVDKYARRLGKKIQTIAPAMISRMCDMKWPGNVRELEGFIQRGLIASSGPVLDYTEREPPPAKIVATPDLDTIQQQYILSVLDQCDWVIGGERGAAAKLGVPASTLRSRMKKLGIERPFETGN